MKMKRLCTDERGISAVVVAVSMIALFGATMLSLDAGNLWQSRRSMVTATDSSALTGARFVGAQTAPLGSGPCPVSVQNTVVAQLTANQPTATLDACTLSNAAAHEGYITVDARKSVDVRFGGIFNIGNQSAFSSSSVRFGLPLGVTGLRPVAFCLDNPHVVEWLQLKNGTISQATFNALPSVDPLEHCLLGVLGCGTNPDGGIHVVHKFFLEKTWDSKNSATSCGGAPGNWGFMDYNGGSNQTNEIRDWFLSGFQSWPVAVGDCDPNTAGSQGCLGNTGSGGNSLDTELNAVLNVPFAVLIYDTACCTGSGGSFDPWGFLGVILRTYTSTGTDPYYGFEIVDLQTDGICCASGTYTGVLTSKICAVDHDPVSEATRCS